MALVEIQTRPDATMPGRLLLAGGLCWLLQRPATLPGDRYELTALAIHLTGTGNAARRMTLGDTQWTLVPREVDVETLDAGNVLDAIVGARAPRELLAWIPLMKHGAEGAAIARWLEVAGAGGHRRGDHSLALVFSESVRCRDAWEAALKGFNTIESTPIREWKDAAELEGKIETRIDWLIRVLKGKYKGEVDEVTAGIRACRDPETLDRWLYVALVVETFEEFRTQTGL